MVTRKADMPVAEVNGVKLNYMQLACKGEGPAEDFAWIVPLPARPEVDAIDAEKNPFPEIITYIESRGIRLVGPGFSRGRSVSRGRGGYRS